MTSNYQVFNAARLQLSKGVNLVEASAGTGKTYAIGMLVLRALVELEIPIEKILIVTFTKAATEELRARIRMRLVEARNLFAPNEKKAELEYDATLVDWASAVGDHRKAYNRLQLALYDIDRAGIFTIHAFCQRMLVEQALESGQLFDVELLSDISQVRNEVAEDFWRSHIYSLEPLPCSLVTTSFESPAALLKSVNSVFNSNGQVEPDVASLEELLSDLTETMTGLGEWWSGNSIALRSCLADGVEKGCFKKYLNENFDPWFLGLENFFTGKTQAVPDKVELLSRPLLQGELNGRKVKKDKQQSFLAEYPLPDDDIENLIEVTHSFLLTIRVLLAKELQKVVSGRLEQQGNMGFNDLILRLSEALKGVRGNALKEILNERFSMALIDEFQDTDYDQWHIFSTLFGSGQHFLYLIGDPKQAIYKFRGADINSYFLARKSATQLLTLDKNYRSHPFLVGEVNRLFASRPNPFFLEESVLDYHPVFAAKSKTDIDLVTAGKSLAGMTYCTLPYNETDKEGKWSSTMAAQQFRDFVTAEIGTLLGTDIPVVQQSGQERPLAPHDIAVLVRSNTQAEEYRQALANVGIPAVVASKRSVFQTTECRQLLLVLQGIASPGNLTKLKTAMTIPWFGFTGNGLQELWQSEELVSTYHSRFLGYNQMWQEQGFMAMMSHVLVQENVLVNLAIKQMAERSIANIQHLIELVQEQESNESLGVEQVLQWLLAMTKEGVKADSAELLLESDEEAVRIVTMHSAKGLEYAVVFCPYLWYKSLWQRNEKHQIVSHDENNIVVVDLGSERFVQRKEKAMLEEMAEDLRLLYVALTRAQICCYTMWADVKKHASVASSFESALGYLLFADGPLGYEAQQDLFIELAQQQSISHRHIDCDDVAMLYTDKALGKELSPRSSSGRSLRTDWQMSSFSAMVSLSEYDNEQSVEDSSTQEETYIPVRGLPAGPSFGNVIHDLLELLPFPEVGQQEDPEKLAELLRQKCKRYGVSAEPADLQKLLYLIVETPLKDQESEKCDNFTLADIPDSKCLKEMGFYFHLSQLDTDLINDVLESDPAVTRLGHKVMRGYLTGFVDLICEYQGRYYILDYKTNYLGEMMEDYGQESLVAAMQSHNYGLQYWIYTLVLHRHLKNILPDYSYQKKFGGVMYLFVRGMSPDIPGSGVFSTLPDYDTLLDLDQIIGGDENG